MTALTFIARRYDIDLADCPPVVISLLIASMSGVLATESALGITLGHAELIDFVEDYLTRFETTGARRASSVTDV